MENAAFLALNYIYLLLGVSNGQCFPPPLSKSEETEMFGKMAQGDMGARTKLIEHNLRLVAHIVRKYYSTQKNQEDLISIGSIGLIKAIDSFKFECGARFATYAAKCIQNEILMYFRSQKKLQSEVSINETIDVDRDGNPLTYIDIISVEDTIAEDIDMALPKNKISHSKTNSRFANWKNRLSTPGLVECPQCHELKKSHVVCPKCGYYDGEQIVSKKEEK
jgi:RNA polymerase sporulation-specific sigma factor